MIVAFPARIDVTPVTTGSYQDVDISAYIGADDAELAFLEIEKISGTDYKSVGIRANGSTDDIRARLIYNYPPDGYYANSVRLSVGLDANHIFEAYIEDSSIKIYLIGYVTSEDAVAFTNCVSKATATTGSYVDVDISSDTGVNTAVAAFCKMFVTLGFGEGTWLRCNSSTDDYSSTNSSALINSPLVKVDANEIFEQYITSTKDDLYLIGYLLDTASGYTLSTNLTGYDSGGTGAWTEFDTGDGANKVSMFLLRRTISTSMRCGLRDVSGTRGSQYLAGQGSFTLVNTDEDGHIEGYQGSSGDFALKLGYYEQPPQTILPIISSGVIHDARQRILRG